MLSSSSIRDACHLLCNDVYATKVIDRLFDDGVNCVFQSNVTELAQTFWMPALHLLNGILVCPTNSRDLIAMSQRNSDQRATNMTCCSKNLAKMSASRRASSQPLHTTQISSLAGLVSDGGSQVAGNESRGASPESDASSRG
jgi:hypothetical protein